MVYRNDLPKKGKSMMKVGSKLSNLGHSNGLTSRGDMILPKTRFSLNDRSMSSPRLKSFPAEKMKRLDPEATENLQKASHVEGDSLQSSFGTRPMFTSKPVMTPRANISSMSDQRVRRIACAPANQANQSEMAIHSQSVSYSPSDRPPRRPNVPNIPHHNMTFRDRSPKKIMTPRLSSSLQPETAAMPYPVQPAPPQGQLPSDPWVAENTATKSHNLERQDVHGTNGGNMVEMVHGKAAQGQTGQPQTSPIGRAYTCNPSPVADPTPIEPQQSYQTYEPHLSPGYYNNRQILMPSRNIEQSIIRYPGMTSPQDIAINQNYQRMVQYGWPVQHLGSPNNRAEYDPTISNGPTQGANINNTDSGYSEQYLRQNGVPNVQLNWQNRQHSEQQEQQLRQYQEQRNSLLATSPQKASAIANSQKKEDSRKLLKFTPAMISDQELLVSTMRQQGIPDDIMRRQFDALLAEQRKQLLYLEQLKQGETNDANKSQECRKVQRKISKIEEDGKPEWMLHITPPRIPYSDFEKMRCDRQQVDCQSPHQHISIEKKVDKPEEPCQTYRIESDNIRNAYVMPEHQNHNFVNQFPAGYYAYPVNYQQQNNYQQHAPHENSQLQIQAYHTPTQNEKPNNKVEPSSLLKLRVYKEVIRRQKQNNGLQDPETVKEALAALANPANRKGLEYLENLNKKPDKPISLNGAQDPHESIAGLVHAPSSNAPTFQHPKMLSANGLENSRNPNNPPPSQTLQKKYIQDTIELEYPRQKVTSVARDCYSLMAERENGTVANNTQANEYRQQQQQLPDAAQNLRYPMNMHPKLENGRQFSSQAQPGIVQYDGKALLNSNPSVPFTIAGERNMHQIQYAPQMIQCHNNHVPSGPVDNSNRQSCMVTTQGMMSQSPQNYNFPCQINQQLYQEITIGGLKYLARKPQYFPNPKVAQYSDPMIRGRLPSYQ